MPESVQFYVGKSPETSLKLMSSIFKPAEPDKVAIRIHLFPSSIHPWLQKGYSRKRDYRKPS